MIQNLNCLSTCQTDRSFFLKVKKHPRQRWSGCIKIRCKIFTIHLQIHLIICIAVFQKICSNSLTEISTGQFFNLMIIFIQRRTVSLTKRNTMLIKKKQAKTAFLWNYWSGGRQILTLWFPKYMQRSNKQNRK